MAFKYMKFTGVFLAFFLVSGFRSAEKIHHESAPTARQIVGMIQKEVGVPWADQTVDAFKAGDPDTPVTGIVCSFMATMDVLYKAVAHNCNMIITHEPIFYNHLDETSQFDHDPVVDAKKKYIADHKLVIWRFHDHFHRMKPDGILTGMIRKLDWEAYQTDDPLIFKLPEMTVRELAVTLKNKFSSATVRIIGDPAMKVSSVAYAAGAPGYMMHVKLLERNDVDALVGGEVPEWESISYVRDAVSQGKKKAMILIGHVNSEEAGMNYCSEWLKGFVTGTPILFIKAGDSFSYY